MTDKTKILLCDDDPDIRKMIRTRLEDKYNLIEATDGEKGLEAIMTESPALVLLDVMMPGLSGWEICKYIREKEEYNHIGIIMLTAIGQTVNELTSPLYGADAYLDKPFQFDELELKIIEILMIKSK